MSETLGGFEHQVMLALMRLAGEAYSVPVVLEIEACTGRSVAPAAVYVTLRRLEKRGLLESHTPPLEPGELGRPRRVFRVTADGVAALRESRRILDNLSEGLVLLDEVP